MISRVSTMPISGGNSLSRQALSSKEASVNIKKSGGVFDEKTVMMESIRLGIGSWKVKSGE
jgi:hypothetical protein